MFLLSAGLELLAYIFIVYACTCGMTALARFHTYLEGVVLYLLRHWSIGDLDLLRQSNPIGGLAARSSRYLSCPHPSGHGAASALACARACPT